MRELKAFLWGLTCILLALAPLFTEFWWVAGAEFAVLSVIAVVLGPGWNGRVS